MSTLRTVVFLLGVLLMALALLVFYFPRPDGRAWDAWTFRLGLLLAVAAHGWPEGLT